jgi:hypothetical protein
MRPVSPPHGRSRRSFGEGVDADEVIRQVVDNQSGRYNAFLQNFAGGFQV